MRALRSVLCSCSATVLTEFVLTRLSIRERWIRSRWQILVESTCRVGTWKSRGPSCTADIWRYANLRQQYYIVIIIIINSSMWTNYPGVAPQRSTWWPNCRTQNSNLLFGFVFYIQDFNDFRKLIETEFKETLSPDSWLWRFIKLYGKEEQQKISNKIVSTIN